MGHMIQCFIGQPVLIETLVSPFVSIDTVKTDLPQGFQCLFLCRKLLSAIHDYKKFDQDEWIEPFGFFSREIKSYMEDRKPSGDMVYLETDYFGGEGSQSAGFFRNGKLLETCHEDSSQIDTAVPYPDRLLNSPINKALRRLGVVRDQSLDEFDTMGLEKYRHMPYNEL